MHLYHGRQNFLKLFKVKLIKIKAKPVYTVLEHHRNVQFLTKLQEHWFRWTKHLKMYVLFVNSIICKHFKMKSSTVVTLLWLIMKREKSQENLKFFCKIINC